MYVCMYVCMCVCVCVCVCVCIGLTLTNTSLSCLPRENHDVVWESKVLFLIKLGKDVEVVVHTMKNQSPLIQAKVC